MKEDEGRWSGMKEEVEDGQGGRKRWKMVRDEGRGGRWSGMKEDGQG